MKKTSILISIIFFTASCYTFETQPKLDVFHKEIPIAGNTNIYFQNIHGSLEIFGWGKNKMIVNAAKYGTNSQRRQIDIDFDKKDNNITMNTLYPRFNDKSNFVNFELRVPEKITFKQIKINKGNFISNQVYGELNVDIETGHIELEDFSGRCRLSTQKGYILARIYEIKKEDDFSFKTQKGDIYIYLPTKINATIEAETAEGKVKSEIIDKNKEKTPVQKWNQILGKGEARLKIQSLEGNINIRKIF